MRPVPWRTMRRDLVARHLLPDVHERRRLRAAGAILAMTGRALRVVERRVVVRDQLDDPRHLVRVDEQQAGFRIERGAAPLRAAVESRETRSCLRTTAACRNPDFIFRNRSSTDACASGVRVVSISSVRPWRANGGGLVGYGCASAAFSPSTLDGGALRYSIGNSDSPVRRSSTNVSPNFVTCATASIAAAVALHGDETRRRRESPSPTRRA